MSLGVNLGGDEGVAGLVEIAQPHGSAGVDPLLAVGYLYPYVVVGEAVHGGTLARLLEQYGARGALEPGIEIVQFPLRNLEHAAATLVPLGYGHDRLYLQGLGTRSLGVGEDVQLRNVEPLDKPAALLEQLFGLAPYAGDEVDPDEGVGNETAYGLYLVGEESRVVVTVHQLQHRVATRLQGYVEVWGKPLRLGYEGDNLVGEQVGLNRGDAVVRDALDLVERADEVEEGLSRLFAEVADIHPRDDNLLTPGGSHFASLCGELFDGAAAAPAPGKGYGAVGAEVVAAVLYLEEVAGAVAPRTRGRELADVAGRGGNHLAHLLPLVQVAQVLQDVELLFGTQNQVHVGDVGNLVGFELRIAAGHYDKGLRVLPGDATDGLPAFLVGQFGHRAGVDYADVGLFAGSCLANAVSLEGLPDGGSFGKVEFAAQCVVGCGLILECVDVYHNRWVEMPI